MQDLIVLELIIVVVLFLAIVRPFVKGFQGIEGIAALPAVALAASISVFPAYGLRPEFLPLLLLSFIMFLGSIPRLVDVLRRLRTDDYGERSFFRLATGILVLGAATVFAVLYAPKSDRVDLPAYREVLVHDDIRDVDLSLRNFTVTGALRRPFILIAPPISGSVSVMNRLCSALSDRGFSVATFSHVGADHPAYLPGGKRVYPPIDTFVSGVSAFFMGRRFAFAARAGAEIERERAADIAFLVKHVRDAAERGEDEYRYIDTDQIVVAGIGAGGAAATIFASSSEAVSIVAAVAVEGPLLSALQGEGPAELVAPEKGENAFSSWIKDTSARFKIERIIGTGVVPAPVIPTLFLVSDHITEPAARDDRYLTVLRSLRTAKAPSAIASVDGAGPFDYSDAGEEYPVYVAMMPGLNKEPRAPGFFVMRAADLISNFVATSVPPTEGTQLLRRTALGEEIRIEAGGPWTSTDVTAILRP